MKISPFVSVACCAAMLAVGSGCLFTRHTTNIVRKNEKPRAVTFESPQAKNMFDSKLVEARVVSNSNFSNPRIVAVPFLLWYSSTDVVSDNGIRNDQLAICDANGDNVVTLDEANIYAARIDEQVAKREAERAKQNAQMAGGQPNLQPPPAQPNYVAPAYMPPNSPPPASVQPASYPVPAGSAQVPLEARGPQAPLPPGAYR